MVEKSAPDDYDHKSASFYCGCLQMNCNFFKQLVSSQESTLHSLNSSGASNVCEWCRRGPSIYDLKRCLTCTSMATSIVGIFNPRYPLGPILGFDSRETAEIHFQCAVDHLCLAIRLRMIRRTEIKPGPL
jgi:hypothetical protein